MKEGAEKKNNLEQDYTNGPQNKVYVKLDFTINSKHSKIPRTSYITISPNGPQKRKEAPSSTANFL